MIILIIILFLIIILYLGVKISINYEKTSDNSQGCLKILILKKIKIYSISFSSMKNETEKRSEQDYIRLLNLLKLLRKDIMRYIKIVAKTSKIEKIQNHVIFGLNDYADTGKYIGIIWAIFSMINNLNKNIKLSAEPTFSKFTINASGVNEFEIYPLKILVPTVRLLLNKEIRKTIKGVINERNS